MNTKAHNKSCLEQLSTGFVSSCQPVDESPMNTPSIIAAMAQASVIGGATGLRIEGINNLQAVRPTVTVPIIGIVKRDLTDSPIRITPYLDDVRQLQAAGADIIAIDATNRPRPEDISTLVKEIHSLGCLAMADCSTYEEGMYCHSIGVEIIGTTMSGYTCVETPKEPDLELVKRLNSSGCRVMAEGRYNTPELAKSAIEAGAFTVTVGSAITRIEHICSWFDKSVTEGRYNTLGNSHE